MGKTIKYMADALGHMVEELIGRKVIIAAPPGVGKTTFIKEVIIPYVERHIKRFSTRNKVLILVNRKALKKQVEASLFKAARKGTISYDSWDVLTYQEVETRISRSSFLYGLLSEYSVIVADEAHYFYYDAAFNNQTMKCLYALLYAGYSKTMIFMSATMDEVGPFITNAWRQVCSTYDGNFYNRDPRLKVRVKPDYKDNKVIIYNDLFEADYSRFSPYVVDTYEELASHLCNSEYKSIVFLDNRVMEKNFTELLKKYGAEKSEIGLINSDNIDSFGNRELIDSITGTNKLNVKYLVSTSVMDNGVSIEDPELRNICIVTTSKLSFIQMLGRVRACEGADKVNLIFVRQKKDNYANILSTSKRIADEIDNFLAHNRGLLTLSDGDDYNILQKLSFGTDDEAKALRSIMMLCPSNPCYLSNSELMHDIYPLGINTCYVVNRIAVARLRNAYFDTRAVYDILSGEDGANELIKYQLSWIGLEDKNPEEIAVNVDYDYKDEMRNELLKIQNYTNKQLSSIKNELGKKYFKKLYPEIEIPAGSRACSDKKLEEILEDVGLYLDKKCSDGKMEYSVLEKISVPA